MPVMIDAGEKTIRAQRSTFSRTGAQGMGLRAVLRALSPGGRRGRLTIVNFHRVHAHPDPLYPQEMDAALFRRRMAWLREWFNIIPLEDGVSALERGTLPERALSVTFDDGYADNETVALPILRELGLHATFFVATAFTDGGRMWNDTVIEAVRAAREPVLDLSAAGMSRYPLPTAEARRAAIERIVDGVKYLAPEEREERVKGIARSAGCELASDLMMSTKQLRSLAAAGMGIGAHTVSHPILCSLDDGSSQREIAQGRETLEAALGQRVTLFAYPNGKPDLDYRQAHVRMVRELGFAAAVSTARGAAGANSDLWQLPRFAPWDRSPLRYGLRLAHNLLVPVAQARA